VAGIVRHQEQIAVMMQCGASLDRVEQEVIANSDLSSDRKAALWLYAQASMEGTEQRARATDYLLNSGR
jgi:hypothetical protein